MYDRKVIRRRRAVLGLLVAASLILVTASFGDGLRSIERGALEVLGPIQEGASSVLKPLRDAAGWVGDTFDAKGENEDLREERDRLRRELIAAQGASRENERLRRLLGMDQRLGLEQQGLVEARVYGRSPTVWYSTVTVNKGTKDGVREGDAVINGAGLVGRVRIASRSSAQVLLITDGDSGVSAKINESGATGIVETAVGDPNDLRLNFLGRDDAVSRGQTVVTSGSTSQRYPSYFPEGIPIGRIVDVDEDEGTVRLRPFADLRRLEDVQIVTEPAT
ncbi:MAG TPA: rod shape-determining protein MreC [Solirubrobacteraceae bacterium]|nr:rod shape-determining protein MreC [Solirubrobacteraceae bacterium]